MEKLQIAIVGYGNIGSFAVQAVEAAPDMDLVGVICPEAKTISLPGVKVVEELEMLGDVKIDVALMCVPTRLVGSIAGKYLEKGINTVDPYDVHGVWDQLQLLDGYARKGGACAIVSAGWDPGADSVVRALMLACVPRGITHTNFGPGMSMGHTVAVKSKDGVKNALSMTIPLGTGIHRRMVYVELDGSKSIEEVAAAVKADPYFSSDETHVMAVPSVDDVRDMGHGVNMVRKGVSGTTQNQRFEFNMSINNPALTAQILVGVARATMIERPGAYTMIEIPVIDMLFGDRDELIRHLV